MTDWKRMFELKQDDWLAVCKEVDQLRAQLQESEEERLEQACLLGMSGERELSLRAHAATLADNLDHMRKERDHYRSQYDLVRSAAEDYKGLLTDAQKLLA